ncbi:proteasome subunit alpha type-5 [Rosa rugosa]|nr:proteasome subunit alpha type-5 [Rosa rugosa]
MASGWALEASLVMADTVEDVPPNRSEAEVAYEVARLTGTGDGPDRLVEIGGPASAIAHGPDAARSTVLANANGARTPKKKGRPRGRHNKPKSQDGELESKRTNLMSRLLDTEEPEAGTGIGTGSIFWFGYYTFAYTEPRSGLRQSKNPSSPTRKPSLIKSLVAEPDLIALSLSLSQIKFLLRSISRGFVSTKMFLTRTEYDRGVNTFSPEGRLFQVEYAIEAIKLGSTAIGLKTKEGVVLAVEKRITSPLLEPSSVEKIMEIDDHIGCAMSGLIADARTLVEHARVETQNHRFSYGEPMTVESTTQALCDLALRFGEGDEESMSRPFGVSLLIAGHDEHGPSLYYTDPSGTFWQCNAKAIGSGSEGADSSLQEQYSKDLTLKEAETIALSILKQVMEEKVTPNNVDIAKVSPTYHLYTPSEVEEVISRL